MRIDHQFEGNILPDAHLEFSSDGYEDRSRQRLNRKVGDRMRYFLEWQALEVTFSSRSNGKKQSCVRMHLQFLHDFRCAEEGLVLEGQK